MLQSQKLEWQKVLVRIKKTQWAFREYHEEELRNLSEIT